MSIKVKLKNESHHPNPTYETSGSAGMDLRAYLSEDLTIKPMERTAIPTGLYIELPIGYEAQVRPRSGLSLKSGIMIPNSPGTIDSDYRGEIKVIVANISNSDVTIKDGDRIAQLVIAQYELATWENADSLTETERNKGGFGSTGIK